MTDLHIECIVLAAGESKRMGKPKLLLPLGQGTILEQTIDNFLNSRVDKVIVVVGDRAEKMTRLIAKRPVKVAVNPIYRQGMSTSIVAGLTCSQCEIEDRAGYSIAIEPCDCSQVLVRFGFF